MDSSRYKDITTSRGLIYHYYFSAPKNDKHILLLLHGFPSSSYDWHNQVAFLEERGYGLIVPDMLGYGGTAKPIDPHQYKSSLVVQDLIDILDAENVNLSVAIGHDW
jgi:pimeloyl-ACP methyl ester carboxylesterase